MIVKVRDIDGLKLTEALEKCFEIADNDLTKIEMKICSQR